MSMGQWHYIPVNKLLEDNSLLLTHLTW